MPAEELPKGAEFSEPPPSRERVDPDLAPEGGVGPSFGTLTSDDKQWGMFCHLSALLGLAIGGLTFVGPLICWMVKKDTSKFVDYHGKESLNFQLNILGYMLIAWAITIVTCGFGIPLVLAVLVYAIVMPIIAGMKANNGELYQYPATIRIIK
jgi:uncharacterized Tic20 family protein